MQYAESILDLVGKTPLVRIDRLLRGLGPPDRLPLVLAKLEMLNPGGSVKDRIGLPMIEAAEQAGLLKPGGTIIEPTSGNTGHGLAIAAALKGYRCIFVMADKQSAEKQALLRAYGAEVVLCPTNVPPESPESYYSVAARLARDIPGAFKPDQYWNMENTRAHERTTGPEIWEQTEGRADALRRKRRHGRHDHRERSTSSARRSPTSSWSAPIPRARCCPATPPARISPRASARTSSRARTTPRRSIAGFGCRIVTHSRWRAGSRARRGSSPASRAGPRWSPRSTWCASWPATDGGDQAVIVTLLPDGGRNYLSKLYNDEWMRANGLLPTTGAIVRIAELLRDRHRDQEIPDVVIARTTDRVGAAIDLLQLYGISQLPVSEQPEGDDLTGIVGSVSERGLLDRAYRNPSVVERTIGEVMDRPLPTLGVETTLDDAFAILSDGAAALLALRGERPAGVVTKLDLLEYIAHRGDGDH